MTERQRRKFLPTSMLLRQQLLFEIDILNQIFCLINVPFNSKTINTRINTIKNAIKTITDGRIHELSIGIITAIICKKYFGKNNSTLQMFHFI